jgi:acetylglutamate kinase
VGIRPVVVHGGGPQITAKLEELGIPSEFRNGFRYTDSQTMTVVRDVLRNQVSRELSELIEAAGAETIVLSGEDDNLFRAEKVTLQSDSGEIDLGLVGEVRSVNPRSILAALEQGKVPVISTVAPTVLGELLNVNADLAAASLAVALGAEKLLVLTDVAGLYADWPNQDSLVSEISAAELRDLIPSLESGMIPKMQACLAAIDGGVPKAHIIDGRQPHSILLEIFTQAGVGTQVTR